MVPKKFVGLHAHSTAGSVGDALGLPQEHIDFAISNGMDSLALTDHGNQNGISHQQIKAMDLKKKGINFKAIPGIEAYFVDSLTEWRMAHATKEPVVKKKSKKVSEESLIGNDLAETEAELERIKPTAASNEDEENGTLVEIEVTPEEAKANAKRGILYQRNHLVLLPKSNKGLKNIFKLVSESFIDGFYKIPRIDFELLRKYSQGEIVALSACIGGRLSKAVLDNVDDITVVSDNNFEKVQAELKRVSEQFVEILGPENFYAELQFNRLIPQHLVNMHLIELAKRTGIKLVATADSHYSNPAHWREREIYKAMAWASKTKGVFDYKKLPEKIEDLKCELYPKNAEQMWASYLANKGDYSFYNDQLVCEAIERTHDIAWNQIGNVEIDKSVKLPAISNLIEKDELESLHKSLGEDASEDTIALKELVKLSIAGLKEHGKANDPVYVARLRRELEDIKYLQQNTKFKFAKYFLTYHKIMEITSKELLTGNGRGSVSGSMLAYVLGISQVDPIRYNTLWERFLNRFKKGAPDIDNDWSDRERAVQMLIEHFGNENVIPVSNFAQLQLRSLIKDIARLHNLPFDEINSATGKIEAEVLDHAKEEEGFDRGVWVLTYEDAEKFSPTFQELISKYPEFQDTIKILFKQMRNISRHAGGVVITDNSTESMPLIKSGGELQTPWPEGVNYRHLEEFGLLKFDILGLGTLRMFENCIRKILIKQGNPNPTFKQIRNWFIANLHPDNCAFDDLNVYKHVFWEDRCCGVFQFVQDNTRKFMVEMKPKSITDIAIATSIFRPGPLKLKVDRKFLTNRNNPQAVTYKHPLQKEVFAETSGLMIFQEQLQMTYHKLAGIPLEETDNVRKAFTKKEISNKAKAEAERAVLCQTFMDLCKKNNNIDPRVSKEIFDEMEALVKYSFNKSHAVAYAITTYQCAWFLTYYPDEWITTYIDYCATSKGKVVGKEDPKAIAIKEAQKLGYTIGKPDINLSEYEYAINPHKPRELIPGFGSLKYVGQTVVDEIRMYRPYTDFKSLLVNPDGKWRHSKFNRRALETLVKLEALDSVGLVGEDKMFRNYRQLFVALIENYDQFKRIAGRKKNNDIGAELESMAENIRLEFEDDWAPKEKIEIQKKLMGSVDFELLLPPDVKERLSKLNIDSIDNWDEDIQEAQKWAIVAGTQIATTKTGKPFLKIRMFAEANKEHICFVWSYKAGSVNIEANDVIVGLFKKGNFGFSAWPNKIFKVNK